jgi:hypothetical protein
MQDFAMRVISFVDRQLPDSAVQCPFWQNIETRTFLRALDYYILYSKTTPLRTPK